MLHFLFLAQVVCLNSPWSLWYSLRDYLHLDTLSLFWFQVLSWLWVSLSSPCWFLDFTVLSTDVINYPFLSDLSTILCCYVLHCRSVSPCSSFSDSFGILLFCWSLCVFYYLRIVPYSWESYALICFQTSRQLKLFTMNFSCLKIRLMQEDIMPANTFFKWLYHTKWGDRADVMANQESVWCFDSLYRECL